MFISMNYFKGKRSKQLYVDHISWYMDSTLNIQCIVCVYIGRIEQSSCKRLNYFLNFYVVVNKLYSHIIIQSNSNISIILSEVGVIIICVLIVLNKEQL